jgi:Fe-S-cluster containining protein
MNPPDKDAQRWLELHATVVDYGTKLAFECRCTKLTPEGRCSIYEDRPMVCELYIAGGMSCLNTVRARRTPEQYQLIRGEDDPLTIHKEPPMSEPAIPELDEEKDKEGDEIDNDLEDDDLEEFEDDDEDEEEETVNESES